MPNFWKRTWASHDQRRRNAGIRTMQIEQLENRALLAVQPLSSLTFGSEGGDTGWAITADSDGYYLAGTFRNVVDFAPGQDFSEQGNPDIRTAQGYPGERDLFVARYDEQHAFQWVHVFPILETAQYSSTHFSAAAADRHGNVYLAGKFADPIDFGSLVLDTPRENRNEDGTFNGNFDSFLAKIGPSGQAEWAMAMAGEMAGAIVVDDKDPDPANWTVYTSSANTLSPEAIGPYLDVYDAVISRRRTSDGQANWSVVLNNGAIGRLSLDTADAYRNMAPDVALGGENNEQLYIGGSFAGQVTWGGTTLSSKHQGATRSDAYLARLTPAGALVWVKGVGGTGEEIGGSIAVADGGVHLLGRFTNSFNLAGTNLSTADSYGVFTARFDLTGTAAWARQLLSNSNARLGEIAAGSSDVLIGLYTGTPNNSQFWQLTAIQGAVTGQWQIAASGSKVFGLAATNDGQFYATGNYLGTANSPDGSSWVSNNGSNDVYVLQFVPPPSEPPTMTGLTDSPDPVVQGALLTLTAQGVTDSDGSVQAVAFYHDSDADGVLDELVDELLGIDTSSVNGWSLSVPTSGLALGLQTYFAVAQDNSGQNSLPAATTGQVVAAPIGNPNDLYVWDIAAERRTRGNKQEARFSVFIRRDSNANGTADTGDTSVSAASVTVVMRRRSDNAIVGTSTGTTNSSGLFTTSWFSNLAAGEYYAEVTSLTHATYNWNGLLDPTGNDTDIDSDGLPDQVVTV